MTVEIFEDYIKYDVFVKRGSLLQNRECLSPSDPDQLYNYLKLNGVKEPELYGIFHPYAEKYKDWEKSDLVSEITKLQQELENLYRHFQI